MDAAAILLFVWFANLPLQCFAQCLPQQDSAETLKKEKEALSERLRLAQMEEEMITCQRRQLETEQRQIRKQQKLLADKELKLLRQPSRNILRCRLQAQNELLKEARRQIEEANLNLALNMQLLKMELGRQEMERRIFISQSRMRTAARKDKKPPSFRSGHIAKERESQEKTTTGRTVGRINNKIIAAQRAREAVLEKQLAACRQSLALVTHEMNSQKTDLIQDRIDRLCEKQNALLDATRQAEEDLRKQQEKISTLIEQAGAMATIGNK